jgi:integrase
MLGAATRERDRIIGLVLLYCGLRAAELCALKIIDLDFRRRQLWVRDGKGAKDRTIPLPKKLLGPLRGWCGARRDGYVFPSRQGGGEMKTRTLQLMVKRWATAAGLHRVTEPRAISPHKFRHAYLSRLLESGATIHEVQRLAGHSNLATTSVYLHCVNDDRLRDAVDRL